MSTGFYLSPGYAWGSKNATTVEGILEIAKTISKDELIEKTLEYDWERRLYAELIGEYADMYRTLPTDDGTLFISNTGDSVASLASSGGGGESR